MASDAINGTNDEKLKGGPPKRFGAGEAFTRLAESDPATREALQRVQQRLRAIAEVFQSPDFQKDLQRSKREQREAIEQLVEEIRSVLLATGDELTAGGLTAPQTLEDWDHLARVVKMPFETVRSGDFTLRDVYVMALAWIERQRVRARIARRAAPNETRPAEAQTKPDAAAQADREGDGPGPDPHDTRKAVWLGKRIYLGDDTGVSRLFWLLARPVGAARSLNELQRAVDGMETDRDCDPDEVRKAGQRVRKVISKLRAALREAELDDHVLIVRGGAQAEPEYTMVWRFAR